MTDKQIIIDGVDVSGCINYTDELKDCSCRLTYAPFHYRFCEQNPNCYYKQLKRKEQELQEALRKQYKCYTCGTCNGKEDYVNMQRHCGNAIKTVQKLNGEIDELNKKLKDVLRLAKENADANEFCLQELEQKVEIQDNTISTYREVITNILKCLIKNNYKKNGPICDTIWYNNGCTLFDYIALACGIEDLQKYEKEVLNDTI